LDDFKKHLKQKVAKKSARCEATYKRALHTPERLSRYAPWWLVPRSLFMI